MSPPRVALVSIGLGRVRRGFERYFEELFDALRDDLDITLWRSASPRDARERVPPLLPAATALARRLPLRRLAGTAEYNRDCLAYALTLLPALCTGGFDVVHCIDPPLGHALAHLKRRLRLRPRILFTEGCVMPPEYFPSADHIHHVAEMQYRRAIAAGVPPSRQTLVPCGFHADRFGPSAHRAALRARHGIAPSTFVVLAIAAIKREHKRVDHLIDEVARLEGDVLLWIDGNPEERALVLHAQARLGDRVRITHVPSAEVAQLYQIADVMAHAALEESFGLSIVEAIASCTPVIVHDAPHFAWLVESAACCVDMRVPGRLAERLGAMMAGARDSAQTLQERRMRARQRFDWSGLRGAYRDLYWRVATPAREAGLAPA